MSNLGLPQIILSLAIYASLLSLMTRFSWVSGAIGRIRLGSSVRERILDAAAAIDRANEDSPAYIAVFRSIGNWFPAYCILSTILAILIPLRMINEAFLIIIYAIGIAVGGLATVFAVSHANATDERHIAVLDPRRISSVLPAYVVAMAFVAALAPLATVNVASLKWTAIAASVGSLAFIYVGLRMAVVPTRLLGADLAAERFVDNRLREARSRGMIAIATISSASILTKPSTTMAIAASAIAMTVMFFVIAWRLHGLYAKPSESELLELRAGIGQTADVAQG